MVRILVCKCSACTTWEIVEMLDGAHHLKCVTCGRTDEVDSFTLHDKPGNNVQWVEVAAE